MHRAFVLAPMVLFACSSFGESGASSGDKGTDAGAPTPGDGDGGGDAGISDAAVIDGPRACARPRFSDSFQRNDLVGGGWDTFPQDAGDSLKLELDTAFHTGDGKSLKVYAAPRQTGEGSHFTKLSDVGRCPIRLSFSLRIEQLPQGDEYVTFAAIELTNATAALTLHRDGLSLSEQFLDGSADTTPRQLPSPAIHEWTKIDFLYDPTVQPLTIDVTVGSQPTVHHATVLPAIGVPQKVHVGAAWASYGVASTFWLDDLSIE